MLLRHNSVETFTVIALKLAYIYEIRGKYNHFKALLPIVHILHDAQHRVSDLKASKKAQLLKVLRRCRAGNVT